MASKYLQFLDAVVTTLQTAFDDAGVDVTVGWDYEFDFELAEFEGLHVEVYPDRDLIDSEATRREDYYDADFSIVMVDRYRDEGHYTKAWVTERVTWVENLIMDVLYPESRPLILSGAYGEFWSQYTNRIVVADMDMLREHGVFFSELESRFRKLRGA